MEKDNESVRRLYDLDTGNIIEVHKGDTLKLIRKDQKNNIEKIIKSKEATKEMKEWNEQLGGFVFVLFKYCDKIFKDYPDITAEDITKLFYLATYVDYGGYLVYEKAYVNRKILKDMLGLSLKAFDLFFNKMKNNNIFTQDEDKNILINKEYFFKGEVNKEVDKHYNYTRVYVNTIRYLFDNVSKSKHKRLGIYFKLIPFIHRQHNTLCWNPDSDKSEIKLMHVRELQELLGYHRNGVRGFIKELLSVKLDNGESILGFFRTEYDEGKSYIIINPKVFYGGNFNLDEGKSSVVKWFSK